MAYFAPALDPLVYVVEIVIVECFYLAVLLVVNVEVHASTKLFSTDLGRK